MEVEKMKRKTIRRLKEIKAEQQLSYSQIMKMLEDAGQYVSEATLKKVFADGSEEKSFRYQDTILPLADVLLDLYGDRSGLEDAVRGVWIMIRPCHSIHNSGVALRDMHLVPGCIPLA